MRISKNERELLQALRDYPVITDCRQKAEQPWKCATPEYCSECRYRYECRQSPFKRNGIALVLRNKEREMRRKKETPSQCRRDRCWMYNDHIPGENSQECRGCSQLKGRQLTKQQIENHNVGLPFHELNWPNTSRGGAW